MKNNIKIWTLALMAVLTGACSDSMLDAPAKSTMDEATIFSTPAFAKDAIAGVIQSFGETNSYRGRYYAHYGLNTDVEVRELKSGDSGTANETLTNYQTSPNNSNMNTGNDTYIKAYEGIERANLAIRGLRAYADLNNWELAQILGEMITLRSVLYLDLLKGWGSVPARFEPISSETVYLPRVDRDEILKHLLNDLEEAATLVGWPNENNYTQTNNHINKAFVKSLRARVALIAGGYSLHMGETTMRLSDDPELSQANMYAIAKQECLDVINSGTARLQPKGAYSNSFEAWIRVAHLEGHAAGGESLWEIPFSATRGRVIYNWGIKHTNVNKFTGQAQGGQIIPNPVMYYKYNPKDVRRDLTCIPYEWTAATAGPTADPQQKLRSLNKWCFGKHRYEWLSRRVTNANDDGMNFLYMRYANVLLMAAEAINAIDGPAAAAPYLKEIKDRAYPNNPEIVATEMAAAQSDFFNAIVDERAKELAGEMYRKEDLIRWNLLTSKMADNRQDLENLGKRTAPYNNVNAKVYYKYAADEVTLVLYGLNPGEMGTPSDPSFKDSKTWELSSTSDAVPYWNRLYMRDPSTQPYWPIWQNILDASNGKIVNDPIFQ